jgi:hypothetical protein
MIIDKVLSDSYAGEIKRALLSDYFPWYFNDHVIQTSKETTDSFQFTHTIVHNNETKSEIFQLIKPMIYFIELHTGIKIKNTVRIKANLITRNNSELNKDRTIHQDNPSSNHKSFIYYVEDSDGDTFMFADDKKTETQRIIPQVNKGVFFDSNVWHTSTQPTIAKRRVIINFLFEVEDEPS